MSMIRSRLVIGIAVALTAGMAAVAVASGELPPIPGIGGGETDVTPVEEAFGSLIDEADEVRGNRPTVVLERDELCLEATDGGACASIDEAIAGELYIFDYCGTLPSGHTRLAGAVTDGVESVQVQLMGTGDVVTAPVVANVYDVELNGIPETLSWSGGAGQSQVEIANPGDLDLSECVAVSEFE